LLLGSQRPVRHGARPHRRSPRRCGPRCGYGAVVKHLLSVDVEIEPLSEMRDVPLTWYVGLDAEGTRIGDALWNGDALDEQARGRVAALFRLTFDKSDVAAASAVSDATYLILAHWRPIRCCA